MLDISSTVAKVLGKARAQPKGQNEIHQAELGDFARLHQISFVDGLSGRYRQLRRERRPASRPLAIAGHIVRIELCA
jgi:hypothetical protein